MQLAPECVRTSLDASLPATWQADSQACDVETAHLRAF
jgi:hypothetical protein